MFYIIMFIKSILLEYILIFCHELIHLICSFFLGLKISFFQVIPFTIYKKPNGIGVNIKSGYEPGFTGRLHFNSCRLTSSLDYSKLLKKLRIFLWVGPIFDFTVFIVLFILGVSLKDSLYLTITALIHLGVASMTFFNSDGKYSIGSKEDARIAYALVNAFTLCGNGDVNYETKRIMTDKHIEISQNIDWTFFQVHDLWNFLNNLSFYTYSICNYLNNDLLSLDDKTEFFMETLITDFDKIKTFDYRQVTKTSSSILLYYIYRKIQYKSFIPDKHVVIEALKYCNSIYYRTLYNYYFNDYNFDFTSCKAYLLTEDNMPMFCHNCPGYSKFFYKLVKLKD
ncbi:hypothetical protein H7E67_10995 [Clostridium gasigenes]|uniref:Peptidase family M50 n=1 Tax=Clostridium gasigenes TaxID=94869 RepID=A0A7X0V6Y2_9CLOT|nr:hypothetical protein [Clostridium gasigenes]MBB6623954.1 hypothetical protein [Clostridium gasigenes]MBB6716058.1 hypothetical protein [Clostridium gasigenes]MBU3087506.1 hypothetical protein [Clostridium gasigenes]